MPKHQTILEDSEHHLNRSEMLQTDKRSASRPLTKSMSARSVSDHTEAKPRWMQLYEAHQSIQNKKQRQKEHHDHIQKAKDNQFSYRPLLNPKKSVNDEPIHQRMHKW